MLLAIDIGNTNIVFAVFGDADEILHRWRIASDAGRTSDEYGALLFVLARQTDFDLRQCRRAIVSSVVPALTEALVAAVRQCCGCVPFVLSAAVLQEASFPLHIEQSAVAEIGSDLICDAMGAWRRFHGANIVVDFGTALSFTVTDSHGVIRGVDIAPGLGTAVKSLFSQTAQLPQVPLAAPPSSLGTNTVESIQAGVVLGYTGLVEYLVARIKQDLVRLTGDAAESVSVVATGGLHGVLTPLSAVFDCVDADMTLRGLKAIADIACPSSD